jgi:hypothetical protein
MDVLNVQFYFVILRFRYTTLIDLVIEVHNLEADILLYLGSTCHAFGDRLCLQLQSRSYSFVYSETKVTDLRNVGIYLPNFTAS